MNAFLPDDRREFYSVREAAWLLGLAPSTVSRAIRSGAIPAVRRRSRLVVPAHVLKRLLKEPSPSYVEELAARLDRFEHVPDEVLWDIVSHEGCTWLTANDHEPDWLDDELTDRELAARICADCQMPLACLELELRTSGDRSLGVWGGLRAEDIRALYPVWLARRRGRTR